MTTLSTVKDELIIRIKLLLVTYGTRAFGFDVKLVHSALLCESIVKQRA